MDVFLEYLVEKKSTGVDILKKAGVVLGTFVAMILGVNLLAIIGALLGIPNELVSFMPLVLAGIVYGAYLILRGFNVEYEYIFTNGDLDIDVIKSRKVRKRLVNITTRRIELMARVDSPIHGREFENSSIAKKYDAVYDASQGGVFGVIFNRDGVRSMLTFQPPEKLAEEMKKLNPRAVFLDE